MTLDQFEKHAGKEGARDWKSSIWVHINDEKVPLKKAKLLQYYKHYSNVANWTSYRKRVYHRDEFVTCSTCKTRRRFHLGTNKELRTYHDAAINQSWTCADWPYDKITCSDDKKKDSRKFCKIYRGCPLSPTCSGCPKCKCSGCVRCRFLDCKCLSCISFMHHAKP
ncbi:Protein ULTRAPETALA 1-like protein [Quillaja saponaria]|uniref:Protein ULTRAPETALA 1-like protein n=1 Tax=Quillaja saponaria TaxID=32244 RepID=A0AAD7QHT4_QUISA|nr:Protein ULTRAPETALA 1-like protein [Quillaja saponaria]